MFLFTNDSNYWYWFDIYLISSSSLWFSFSCSILILSLMNLNTGYLPDFMGKYEFLYICSNFSWYLSSMAGIYPNKLFKAIFFSFLRAKAISSTEFNFISLFSTHLTRAKLKQIKYHGLKAFVTRKSNN